MASGGGVSTKLSPEVLHDIDTVRMAIEEFVAKYGDACGTETTPKLNAVMYWFQSCAAHVCDEVES